MKWTGLVVLIGLFGCDTSETALYDEEALKLLAMMRDQNYGQNEEMWGRAPGFETRRESMSPHGAKSEIWVTRNVIDMHEANLEGPWPVESMAIKHGYDANDNLTSRALMVHQPWGWFYAVFTPDDRIIASGYPQMCKDCHPAASGALRFVDFP